MFNCIKCDKIFKTQKALNAHQVCHKNNKRYSTIKSIKTYNCINCNKTNNVLKDNKNKFCNNKCQQEHIWHTVSIPKILSGIASPRLLKKYLIEMNGNICQLCKITEWNNLPISLHLDHIDGDHNNNVISNGRILCPNCHSQTPTWGRKIRK